MYSAGDYGPVVLSELFFLKYEMAGYFSVGPRMFGLIILKDYSFKLDYIVGFPLIFQGIFDLTPSTKLL